MPAPVPAARFIRRYVFWRDLFWSKHVFYCLGYMLLITLWVWTHYLSTSNPSPQVDDVADTTSSPAAVANGGQPQGFAAFINLGITAILGNALWGFIKCLRYFCRYLLYYFFPDYRHTLDKLDSNLTTCTYSTSLLAYLCGGVIRLTETEMIHGGSKMILRQILANTINGNSVPR